MKKKNTFWQWTKSKLARQVFSVSRWLHIYISTALFTLLIIFSFTGITLNHPNWLSGTDNKGLTSYPVYQGIIDDWEKSGKPDINALEVFIETQTQLKSPQKIDIDLEYAEATFDYPLPAGYAFITVSKENKEMEVEYETGNIWALLNDLHKGRHTGTQWSWLIDISAALMILFGITGMIILFQHVKQRKTGLLLTIAGTLLPVIIYVLWVPALGN